MTVASEIKAVGDHTPVIGVAAGAAIGSAVTLPKGTKWAVIFASAQAGTAVAAGTVGAVALFDGTAEILTVTPPGLVGGSASLSNQGAPLAILDATSAAITAQARASAGNTAAETLSGVFILEQCY